MRLVRFASLLFLLSWAAEAAGKPEDELTAVIKAFYGKGFAGEWLSVESLPGTQWAPLPPRALQNCLPDGSCFTRQGTLVIGGRNLVLMATGARTMVNFLYLRNGSAPFGEAAVLAALKAAGITAELARCPVPGTTGGTNWYRLKGAAISAGVLSVQTSCNGRPCEGFVLSRGEELPALQPAQLRLYSEQCSAAGGDRKPVSTMLPHESLAQLIGGLIPVVGGPVLVDWKSLAGGSTPVRWSGSAPTKMDLTFKGDPNPFGQSGDVALSGRKFGVLASGSATQAKVLYLDEMGMHPKGEHLLGVLYAQGFTVQLARCGPVYTESTNNWYSVKSAKTHPVMLRQSIRYEGNQVQDAYEIRLDNTLPKRDGRDRDPGVGGCR